MSFRAPVRRRNEGSNHAHGSGSYLALDLGVGIEAAVIECQVGRPAWHPYVEVAGPQIALCQSKP
jgi:hypothetical protein